MYPKILDLKYVYEAELNKCQVTDSIVKTGHQINGIQKRQNQVQGRTIVNIDENEDGIV